MNRDLKESAKRNKSLSGTMKQVEEQLKVKEVKKRMNRDLKESAKRNKSLSGTMKQVEEQLKVKEEKYQCLLAAKRNGDAILKEKQKELKSLAQRGLNFERTI